MPWFKVDDGLFLHQKIVRAGNAAMGLWLRAGSWSAHHLTEGFVPDAVIEVLGTASQRSKLIKAGLWSEAEGGCQFHEWNERQPSRDEVTDQRSAWADRKRKSREKLRESSAEAPRKSSETSEISASSQVSGMSHASVTPSIPVPSRPELQESPSGPLVARPAHLALAVQPPLLAEVTEPSPSAPAAKKSQGHRLSEDWRPTSATMDWSRQLSDQLDITAEWARFQDYWLAKAGAGARKLDWDRTWKNWLRTALERSRGRGPGGRPGAAPSARAQRLAHSASLVQKFAAMDAAEAQPVHQEAILG